MKGESGRPRRAGRVTPGIAREIALEIFAALAGSPERAGRFLSATGLDPAGLRHAAGEPGFWPALLDHVAGDEPLLLDLAAETGIGPDRIMQARHVLAPPDEGFDA